MRTQNASASPVREISGVPPPSAPPVLVSPDAFKGTLRASEVAGAIGRGLERAGLHPPDLCPVADGGEGTLEVLLTALGGVGVAVFSHADWGDNLLGDVGDRGIDEAFAGEQPDRGVDDVVAPRRPMCGRRGRVLGHDSKRFGKGVWRGGRERPVALL